MRCPYERCLPATLSARYPRVTEGGIVTGCNGEGSEKGSERACAQGARANAARQAPAPAAAKQEAHKAGQHRRPGRRSAPLPTGAAGLPQVLEDSLHGAQPPPRRSTCNARGKPGQVIGHPLRWCLEVARPGTPALC